MSTNTGLLDVAGAAKALAPQIRANRDEIEALRRLPPQIVEALDQAGLLQLNLPRSMGGRETDPLTSFLAIEELSKADGSVGWCAFLSSGVSLLAGWLPAQVGRDLFGQPPDVRFAGSLRPEGAALAVPGGYRVSGRWNYGSGVDHANWLICTCTIADENGPVLRPGGMQDTRSFMVPKTSIQVHDVWDVIGMRGTGSNDFTVDDIFVPAERSFSIDEDSCESSPLFNRRLVMVNIWSANAANALGMARGAMDAFVEIATKSGSTRSATLLRDRANVQTAAGQAEAIISSARAYALDATGAAWSAVSDGARDPSAEIAQARLAITFAIQESVRAVDILFHAAGTNAIHSKHPLERFFRDIHVAVQHIAGLPSNIEMAGQSLLGLPPQATGW